jgi:cytoskeleton protein RodZ
MSQDTVTPASAGQLLRQAREQRRLSVQQVALQLNLKPEQVEKLEQDKLDGSVLETFARGYVRAYGRLLKLPEAELMAAFSRQTGFQAPATKPMRTFSNRAAHQATENRFMWLTYAIVALLLVLLFVWWWQSARSSSDSTIVDQITQGLAVPEQTRIAQTATETTLSVDAAPLAAAVVATDKAGDANQLEPAPLTPAPAEPVVEVLAAADSATLSATSLAAPSTTPLTALTTTEAQGADTLEMRFSENCWVNVVDAAGNRVAYGTKQAGYIMQLKGTAPFEVTLGNPSVVQINFNQQAFDMSAFPGGRVAKFTLPEFE